MAQDRTKDNSQTPTGAPSSPLSTAPIDSRSELRQVVAMTIPAVVTTSSRGIMDIADFIMLGRSTNDETLAAIVPAQLLMWTYLVVGMGIVSMVNTFAAQELGRKRYENCATPAWQGLWVAAGGRAGGVCRPGAHADDHRLDRTRAGC